MCTQAQADNERGRPKGRERVAGRRCCCGGSRCCRRSHTRTHMHGEKTRISPLSLLREGGRRRRRLRRHPPPSPVGVGRRSPSCCSPIFWIGLGRAERERGRQRKIRLYCLDRPMREIIFPTPPFLYGLGKLDIGVLLKVLLLLQFFLHLQLICWLHWSCL